jgi:broad specificity phosphatase PhoE
MTVLHLVRHGQSEWNVAGRLQGQSAHVRLTARGRDQARATATRLQDQSVAAVYSSDLVRAAETAAIIADRMGLDVLTMPGLRERGYGYFEGQLSTDVLAATVDVDWTDPDVRIGGAESISDVFLRIGQTLAAILKKHEKQTVVIVSHGDTIRVAAAWLNGANADQVPWLEVPNGSITTIRHGTPSRLGCQV